MSTKEEKPTLGGVRIRQRKRNINVPLDPVSFADAILDICKDAKESAPEGSSLEAILESATKGFAGADLDYNRYGDTFFEIIFTGWLMGSGSDDKGKSEDEDLGLYVLAAEATHDSILPYVVLMQSIIQRKPFLVKNLEATLVKVLKQLEFYDAVGKKKLAIATALIFNMKLGPLPDQVLQSLLDDAKVNKGTSLEFLTQFCTEYLTKDPIEELDLLLRRAKLDDKMLDFFPQQKRSIAHFNAYFTESGLVALVDLNKKRFSDANLRKLGEELKEHIKEDGGVAEALELIELRMEEMKLTAMDVLPVLWKSVMDSAERSTKSSTQQQTHQAVLRLLRTWMKIYQTHCQTSKQELLLMNVVQVSARACSNERPSVRFRSIDRCMMHASFMVRGAWFRARTQTLTLAYLVDILPLFSFCWISCTATRTRASSSSSLRSSSSFTTRTSSRRTRSWLGGAARAAPRAGRFSWWTWSPSSSGLRRPPKRRRRTTRATKRSEE